LEWISYSKYKKVTDDTYTVKKKYLNAYAKHELKDGDKFEFKITKHSSKSGYVCMGVLKSKYASKLKSRPDYNRSKYGMCVRTDG